MDRSHSHGLLKGVEFNYEVMEEELTCPVCLELYADPLLLPCSHSVCKKCLQDIFDSKLNKQGDYCVLEYELECPSCRRELTLTRAQISELPKNLALENIVIRYTEERSKSIRKSLSLESPISDLLLSPILNLDNIPEFPSDSTTPCELCDGKGSNMAANMGSNMAANMVAWYCSQCAVGYCQACLSKYHPNKGPLSRHKLVQYSDGDHHQGAVRCGDHEREEAVMFCDDCLVSVCPLCVCQGEGQHVSHNILSLDAAGKKLRGGMEETKTSCDNQLSRLADHRTKLQAYNDDISTLHNQSVARVEQHYCRLVADLTDALEVEKSRVINDLSAAHSQEVKKVRGCLQENETCGEVLLKVSRDCSSLLEESTRELLAMAGTVDTIRSTLHTHTKQAESLAQDYEATVHNKSTRCRLQSGTLNFKEGANNMLHMFTASESGSTTIVPLVQTPTSPGRADLSPKSPVQNKCLITWGFSSTSFTGAELTANSTWTVTIERNTGGNLGTGCLFGVGVSSERLNVKDIVGSTAGTYGVVCNSGVVYFVADGKQERLIQLENLPISVTLSVNMENERYTVLSYKLEAAPKENQCLPLEGRKVLDDVRLKGVIYPVFTVSQRVKLLFPTYV